LFGTLQDRWVKALREARAATIAQANELVDRELLTQFNSRFTVRASSSLDAHLPAPQPRELAAILCEQVERTVGNDYTVRIARQVLQISPPPLPGLRGAKVLVERRADGELKLRFKSRYLPFEARPPADNSTLQEWRTF
jgi:hypothetical protein